MPANDPARRRKRLWFLLGFTAIFLLNDFSNIFIRNYLVWLLIDYVSAKLLPILMIVYLIKNGIAAWSDFGIKGIEIRALVGLTILLSVVGILVDQIGWRFFEQVLPKTQLGCWPKIENPIINGVDLSLGLILVGFIEETIFRGFYFTVLRQYLGRTDFLIALCTVVFGLIHWSLGLHAIVNCAIWGILPLIVMWKTGSVIPSIIAHFLTDLVAFSNVVPSGWLKWV